MTQYLDIAHDIETGLRTTGGGVRVIASESELSARYGVSRTTIRAALRQLEHRGLIERRQGSGTFYRPPHITKNLGSLVDFHTEARSAGRVPMTRVVSLRVRPASAAEFTLFGAEAVFAGIVDLVRLRSLDAEPAVLQRSTLTKASFGDAEPGALENGSLYGYLAERRGITVESVEETLEPCCVSAEEAEPLAIAAGTAVFRSYRIARDPAGRVIEVSDNLIRGDIYRFTVHHRAGEQPTSGARGG